MFKEPTHNPLGTPEQEARKKELLQRLQIVEDEIVKLENAADAEPLLVRISRGKNGRGEIDFPSDPTKEEEERIVRLDKEIHDILLELEEMGVSFLSEVD